MRNGWLLSLWVLACGPSSATAAEVLRISFQPPRAAVQEGWIADCGAAFAERQGLRFGWDAPNPTAYDRGSARSPDQTHDTLIHLQRAEHPDARWEIVVPDGFYHVRVICGDATYTNSVFRIAVEDRVVVDGTPGVGRHWLSGTGVVEVRDGRLTITNAPGAVNNKLCGIEITAVAHNG